MLLLLVLGFLRGGKDVKAILQTYAEDREMLDFLGFKRVPAQGTYTNLWKHLELETVNRALENTGYSLRWHSRHVALDGKTTKGSLRDGLYLHVVNAATTEGIVLAQQVSQPAGGEIAAANVVVERLPLEGAVVSGDAMFAQRDLCEAIWEKRVLILVADPDVHAYAAKKLQDQNLVIPYQEQGVHQQYSIECEPGTVPDTPFLPPHTGRVISIWWWK